MPDFAQYMKELSILAVPLLLALTFHEAAHGYVAWRLGDPTARQMGRLTLNPLKHLDLLGTLAFLVTRMVGWAKPVPVDSRYFKNPQRGMLLVALAGPCANMLLAVACAAVFHLLAGVEVRDPNSLLVDILVPLAVMAEAGVIVNVALAAFNLLPVPPLDGSNILAGFLPPRLAYRYLSLSRYGFIVLIVLAVAGVLGRIMLPVIEAGSSLLLQ
jgi:Zn-dependent protease